ncbi:hypothetical protein KGA66_26100 [Actinocrinis puniceicyclus]|uniref:Lipoprotein n=1 Tax=Actinocrinis puniceicyclus TaxID=977794 RepID=A0A8J7WUU4_9ACTN|nr:hypothetical protein [Actinocrinis puniceicyclus]MBS2966539.1 hypothetical protein [Actinocrinis puniceicyclus]
MRTTRVHATVVAVTVAGALATACSSGAQLPGNGNTAANSPKSTPAAATASPSPSTPAQQALAAYEAMWVDVQALDQTSDYQNPRLTAHLDGKALLTISENMAVNKAHGIVALGAPLLHPSVISAGTTVVTLRDCLDDTHWLEYYAATHKPVDDVPGGHRYIAATVTDENNTWKVTALDTKGEGTC